MLTYEQALVAAAKRVMDEEWDSYAQKQMLKASKDLDLSELADDDHEWEELREVVQEVISDDMIAILSLVYEQDATDDLETAVINQWIEQQK